MIRFNTGKEMDSSSAALGIREIAKKTSNTTAMAASKRKISRHDMPSLQRRFPIKYGPDAAPTQYAACERFR